MAFLCPVRIRKGRRKKVPQEDTLPGRITGSASVDTVDRVGLEKEQASYKPETIMAVVHDFVPCVDDELAVKRGDEVRVLYQDNDWLYVITVEDSREGFIPYTYCVPADTKRDSSRSRGYSNQVNVQTESTKDKNHGFKETTISGNTDRNAGMAISRYQIIPTTSPQNNQEDPDTPVQVFQKVSSGRYIVLFKFTAFQENDLSVKRGEFVSVLNKDDPDWFWVKRADGDEGFVPGAFLCPAEGQTFDTSSVSAQTADSWHDRSSVTSRQYEDITMTATQLISLYDYQAQSTQDLSVRKGQRLYVDPAGQSDDRWLWAFCAETQRHGYIPKAYVRQPFITQL